MSLLNCMPQLRHLTLLGAAACLGLGFAPAQSTAFSSGSTSVASSESSSTQTQLVADDDVTGAAALHEAASAMGAGAGQSSERHGMFSLSNLAIVAGGGFNAPIGNDTPYITWGGNFTGGAGLYFSKSFSVLGEFQFMDNKLPGAFVAAGGGQTGNAHIVSLTVDPWFDLFPKKANSIYVTGGGGYYHKSTNFNVLGGYDFYGYPVFVTANSFSSNQGGFNFGMGFMHRLGGAYGDSKMKLFAEARYTYIHTPPITQANGLGTTALIPVTMGLRW